MSEYLRIILLGIVQGITEFLPISSDGHLVVVSALYAAATGETLDDTLAVEIVLHAGTLLAVVIVFWQQLWRLLFADRRVIGLLIVGTLPAVVVGVVLKLWFKEVLENPLAAGLGLIGTGIALLWAARYEHGDKEYQDLSYRDAFLIGVFQAAAILPGLSRSGLTISSALALIGMRRAAAANFSFLLAVPAIGGAVTVQMIELVRHGTGGTSVRVLAVGAVVSFLVGLAALTWLLKWLRHGRLEHFAWWCIPVGIAVVVWQAML